MSRLKESIVSGNKHLKEALKVFGKKTDYLMFQAKSVVEDELPTIQLIPVGNQRNNPIGIVGKELSDSGMEQAIAKETAKLNDYIDSMISRLEDL